MAAHFYRHHQARITSLFACALLLAGCKSAPTAAAPAIPVPRAILVAPAESYWQAAINHCVEAQPDMGVLVEISRIQPETLEANDWVLSAADPGAREAYDLGSDNLKIIVHPDSPLKTLSAQQAAGIYTGFIRTWGDLNANLPEDWRNRAIHFYTYPAEDELAQLFTSAVLNGEETGLRAIDAPDPVAVIRAVTSDPDGIGYVPSAWMTSTVKALESDTVPSFQLSLSVGQPPSPTEQIFIACLQKTAAQ